MHPNLSFINPSFVSRPCSIPFFLLLAQSGCGRRATLRLVIEGGKKVSKERKELNHYHITSRKISSVPYFLVFQMETSLPTLYFGPILTSHKYLHYFLTPCFHPPFLTDL